jgi:hypothetical protein
VQVVHYPLFCSVGPEQFRSYEKAHSQSITWIVGPTMLIEAGTGLQLVFNAPDELSRSGLAIGALLILVIWLSTALIQMPCHKRLMSGFDAVVHRRLVLSNWIRTVAWTARGLIVVLQTSLMIRS